MIVRSSPQWGAAVTVSVCMGPGHNLKLQKSDSKPYGTPSLAALDTLDSMSCCSGPNSITLSSAIAQFSVLENHNPVAAITSEIRYADQNNDANKNSFRNN